MKSELTMFEQQRDSAVAQIRFPKRLSALNAEERSIVALGRGFDIYLELSDTREGSLTLSTLASERDGGGRALLEAARGILAFERLIADPEASVDLGASDLTSLDATVRNHINGSAVPSWVWANVRARTREATAAPASTFELRIRWYPTPFVLDLPRDARHAPLP